MHHSMAARMASTLRWLMQHGPQARTGAAADVAERLVKEQLAHVVMLPSPYAADRGKPIPHLQITDAGRDRIGGD